MKNGIKPIYAGEKAGEYRAAIDLLMGNYDPKDLISFQASLDAIYKKYTDFQKAIEEVEMPPVGTLMSDVVPKSIDWLWFPRLAIGKLAMLDGDPGLGKSSITNDIAARVSTGSKMPDGTQGVKGGVVLITPEDELDDTIQPRLARAGADLTKIVSIGRIPETTTDGFKYERPFTLPGDLPILEAAINRVKAKLIIIDPVMAIMGSKDTYKDNEVRTILAPVQMLVAKARATCILVRHLTKGGGDNPLYRGGGSIGFIGLARTGLMVVKDPTAPSDENRMLFAHIKSNAGELANALTYTIVSDKNEDPRDDRPYVKWGDESSVTANELLSAPRVNTGSNRQKILDVLEEKEPEEMSIAEISAELPDMSMSNLKTTLKRMYDSKEIGKSERGSYHAL